MAPVLTRLLFLLLVLSVAACSAGSVSTQDGAPDISDAAVDAGPDGAQDSWADAGSDPGADVQSDAGTDAGPDTGSDAGSDAGADASPHDFLWGEDPPSTLLPPDTTELGFTVHSTLPASCTFSIGTDVPYPGTTAFDQGQGTLDHGVTLRPLNPDTTVVNEVYVRCDAQPDFVLHLRYRNLPDARPSFPRKGNLWGWWGLVPKGLDYCARIDLYLGADFAPADSVQLRQLNPNVLILTSVNTVERNGDEVVPDDDYWLKDVNGNRIEVWNNAYRINLTKPEVAEWQARYAYQKILDSSA